MSLLSISSLLANTNGYIAGTPLLYTVIVRNGGTTSGNVSVAFVPTAPAGAPVILTNSVPIILGTSRYAIFYATYTATVADVAHGIITYTVTATDGTSTASMPISTPASSNGISVTKTANNLIALSHASMTYNYLIQNSNASQVYITSVTDANSVLGTLTGTVNGNTTDTIPGAVGGVPSSITFKASGTLPTIINNVNDVVTVTTNVGTASATLITPPSEFVTSSSYNGVTITESASPNPFTGFNPPGSPITFTYNVTNNSFSTITGATVTDFNPGIIITGPATIAPLTTATYTGTYIVTVADVGNGYINSVGMSNGLVTIDGTTTFPTVAYSALVVPYVAICIHSSSQVWYLPDAKVEKKMSRMISEIKAGDHVLGVDGRPAKVLDVPACQPRHPGSKEPHSCIVFPPDSIKDGVPSSLFVVDPGHPISTPEFFLRAGQEGLVPAIWYCTESKSAYKSDWYTVAKILPGSLLRYDLILETTSCGAYLANNVAVRARWRLDTPNYWHDADD